MKGVNVFYEAMLIKLIGIPVDNDSNRCDLRRPVKTHHCIF